MKFFATVTLYICHKVTCVYTYHTMQESCYHLCKIKYCFILVWFCRILLLCKTCNELCKILHCRMQDHALLCARIFHAIYHVLLYAVTWAKSCTACFMRDLHHCTHHSFLWKNLAGFMLVLFFTRILHWNLKILAVLVQDVQETGQTLCKIDSCKTCKIGSKKVQFLAIENLQVLASHFYQVKMKIVKESTSTCTAEVQTLLGTLPLFCNNSDGMDISSYPLLIWMFFSLGVASIVRRPRPKNRERGLVAFPSIFCRPLPLKILSSHSIGLQNETMRNVIPSHVHEGKSNDTQYSRVASSVSPTYVRQWYRIYGRSVDDQNWRALFTHTGYWDNLPDRLLGLAWVSINWNDLSEFVYRQVCIQAG